MRPIIKNSAVKLILEEGYSVKEVSQELEVHANSLYRWVQEVEEYGESGDPHRSGKCGGGVVTSSRNN
ncbi:transposase, partial [Klebsiella pneumoniae]|uniref:transposase n=1 Tax=Klebsiella pneumoniae TaxID=573 RepID=UPI0039C137A5